MLKNARRVAWLILILGVLAAATALIISQANLADNFLTFSLVQLLWMGLLYVVVGIVLLLLLRPSAEPVVTAAVAAPTPSAINQPDPQDLTLIEGIGPKSKEALNKSGIYTFAQLLDKDPEELLRIVRDRHGVRVVGNATATWTKQARYIVNGDLAGLKQYQDFLQAGRE